MSLQLSAKEEMVEKFLDCSARGDLTTVTTLLSQASSLINHRGENDWTALMFAARNGHYEVVKELLQRGCDRSLVNSSSQTACDIAKFWGHKHISTLLSRAEGTGQQTAPGFELCTQEHYFGRETLDRLSVKRTDTEWLETKQKNPDSVYLLFSNLIPMVSRQTGDTEEGGIKLCRLRYEAVQDLLQKPETVLIFLGVKKTSISSSSSSLTEVKVEEFPAWFAISTEENAAELLKRCQQKNCFFPEKSSFRDLLKLPVEESGVVAQARSTLAWHDRYAFCPTCGSATKVEEGGYKRSCLSSDCRSLKGVHNTSYPRVDPVVIMLVVHPDGNHCLLGRKKIFPVGVFSCLAGFIEPGETVEDAVRREVDEESSVKVGDVQYVSSQPWPNPSNLMIGCLAAATSTDIRVDEKEIEEARWFSRQEVIDALYRKAASVLLVPPRQTIAHQLIKHWIGVSSNL